MTSATQAAPDSPELAGGIPAPAALLGLIMGSMLTQALHVAAKLGIADILRDGPLTGDEIGHRAGSDADSTARLIRALASFAIFQELPDGRFDLTPMADALRSDAPESMRNMALLVGHPLHWEDWSNLIYSVESGQPVLPKFRGMGGYEYLAANPEFAQVFEAGMGTLSNLETIPIAEAYDFSDAATVIDVFGGRGNLLVEILKRTPGARGVLVDQRAEALGAAAYFAESGVADRCTVDGTDLFAVPPAGGDAYILKHIVHEWPEEQSLQILRSVRSAMSPQSRLLLMEYVLPEGNEPHPGRLVDLWLMILMGGRERNLAQYAELLGRAGLELSKVIATAAGVAIIEARPV